jgi:hypothetical protein
MYRIVRTNNENHKRRDVALWDSTTIIERGFWWRMNEPTHLPYGTLLIGMGCHGGAGTFMLGIVAGEWEKEPDGGPWTVRVPVVWQPVIYIHGQNLNDGKNAVKNVHNMLGVHVVRSNMELSQTQYRKVLDFVLRGEAVEANFTEPGSQAA